jgi:hypothetical protein
MRPVKSIREPTPRNLGEQAAVEVIEEPARLQGDDKAICPPPESCRPAPKVLGCSQWQQIKLTEET